MRSIFFDCFLALALFSLVLVGCSKKEEEEILPPTLENPLATPASVVQGSSVRLTVQASSSQSTIQTVTIDISAIGGSALQAMYDDGTNGDLGAADGMYSYAYLMPNNATTGAANLPIEASDARGISASTTLLLTVVQNQPPTILNGTISRDPVAPGSRFTVTVDASDPDGTLFSVEADLTPLGMVANATLYDDGTHGDASASDGTFSFEGLASPSATPAAGVSIVFTAEDNATATNTTNVTFDVSSNVAPAMTNESVSPPSQVQRLDMTFSVDVTDSDGLTSVTLDLSPMNGSPTQAMTNTVGDTYEYIYTLPWDCPPGSWSITMTATDTLAETNFTVVLAAVFANNPPTFLNETATPDPVARNKNVLLTVDVADADGTVASVEIDLSAISGSPTQTMYDDGSNGDAAAFDGTYSYEYFVPSGAAVNTHALPVTATDDDTVSSQTNISAQTLTNCAPSISNPQASPTTQEVGFSVLFSVDATDDAAGLTVTIDLSSIGGSSTQAMVNSSGDIWDYTYILPGATTAGGKTLPVTATDADASPEFVQTNISFTVQANQAPSVSNAAASPAIALPGRTITITVDASDSHTLSSVTADLSALGRSTTEPMYDDGATGGDAAADGTWTCQCTAAALTTPGQQTVNMTATDTLSLAANTSTTVRIARYHLEHAAFLEDIHGSSSTNAFAVGEASQVFHWNGSDWRLTDAYPGQNVNWWSVWCDSSTDVWVGGAGGEIRCFDGKDWTSNNPGGAGSYEIRGIWGDGAGNFVVVGGLPGTGSGDHGGWANTWNGSAWGGTPVTDGNNDFNDVFGATTSDMMIVGDDSTFVHWNGTAWSASTISGTSLDLFGVWGFDDGTNTYYWVVAGDWSRTVNTAEIWTTSFTSGTSPSSWTQIGSLPYTNIDLQGIHGSVSATTGNLLSIFVTGKYATQNYGTVWESTDGTSFTQVTTGNNYFPNAPYRLILTDVWVPTNSQDCWIAGHRTIQYYNSSANPTWVEYSRGTYEDTRAVTVNSATRGLTWDFPGRPGSTGGKQISSIAHDYGSGTWTEYTIYTSSVGAELATYTMLDPPAQQGGTAVCPRMYAMCMFSTSAVYGVGDDGHVMFWDGQNVTTHDFTSQTQYGSGSSNQRRLYTIWGVSATDFWFGGEDNYVYHYQGSSWPTGTQLPNVVSPKFVTGIWGPSGSSIYAVTAASGVGGRTATEGDVSHYDSSTGVWTSIAGTDDLPGVSNGNHNAVWGTGTGDVYVVSDGGGIVHLSGGSWTDISGSLIGSAGVDLMAVFGDASIPEVYVVGDNMHVWLYKNSTWYDLRACGGSKDLLGGDSDSTLILMAGTDGITLTLEK